MSRYYKIPFANLGNRTAIPDPAQGSGSISYTDGWGINYQLDQNTNPSALDIPRQSENQFKFDITLFAKEIQELGILPYRADVDFLVPAFVIGSDGNLYKSTALNGPDTTVVNPVGDLTGVWILPFEDRQVHGFQIFIADGTFNRPAGVTRYKVTCVGGGGGGGAGVGMQYAGDGGEVMAWACGGGAGGSGGIAIGFSGEASGDIVIGAGGAGGVATNGVPGVGPISSTAGSLGEDTTFTAATDTLIGGDGGLGLAGATNNLNIATLAAYEQVNFGGQGGRRGNAGGTISIGGSQDFPLANVGPSSIFKTIAQDMGAGAIPNGAALQAEGGRYFNSANFPPGQKGEGGAGGDGKVGKNGAGAFTTSSTDGSAGGDGFVIIEW